MVTTRSRLDTLLYSNKKGCCGLLPFFLCVINKIIINFDDLHISHGENISDIHTTIAMTPFFLQPSSRSELKMVRYGVIIAQMGMGSKTNQRKTVGFSAVSPTRRLKS